MFKLFKYKLINFVELLFTTLGYVIASLSFLSIFYINKVITDYAKGIASLNENYFYLIIVFLIFLQMGLVFYFANYFVQKSILNIGGRTFNLIFRKIFKMPPSDYEKINKPTILNILFSDTFFSANLTVASISGILGNFISILIACLILYNIKAQLLGVSALLLPLYFIISIVGSYMIKKKNKVLLSKNDVLMKNTKNYSENIPIIKMLDYNQNLKTNFRQTVSEYTDADNKKYFYENLFTAIFSMFGVISQIIILIVGSTYVLNQGMTIGTLIMYSGISGFLFEPVSNISKIIQMIKSGKPNLDRIINILNLDSDTLDNYEKFFGETEYGIEAKGLVKDNLNNVLYEIDIRLPRKGFYVLRGPNGSGKSTLFNIISGIYAPSQFDGNIKINNSFKNDIGILNYPIFLMDKEVNENICLGDKKAYLDIFNMDLDKVITSNPPNISSGEAQKVAISRVLNLDNKMILIDEPSTNLETKAIKDLIKYIVEEKNTKLIIAITHDDNYDDIVDGYLDINNQSIKFIYTH